MIGSDSLEAVGGLGLVAGDIADDCTESGAGGGTISERGGEGGLLLAGSLFGGELDRPAAIVIALLLRVRIVAFHTGISFVALCFIFTTIDNVRNGLVPGGLVANCIVHSSHIVFEIHNFIIDAIHDFHLGILNIHDGLVEELLLFLTEVGESALSVLSKLLKVVYDERHDG